jgi:hypothetical protein
MPSSHVLLDQVDFAFDDERAVAGAGLLLLATLAERLGIEQATDQLVDLGGPGGRVGRLDSESALAGRRHPRGGCWWGESWAACWHLGWG